LFMTQYRTDALENDQYYHIFSRSIAKYVIFNDAEDYSRFMEIADLYRHTKFYYQYSKFKRLSPIIQSEILAQIHSDNDVYAETVAFCLMPTHFHFLLKQRSDGGISKYIGTILNCYSRYFNIKHGRTGPLWSGRFKNVLVKNDEQLLHLTRYIHLNPCSAGLVEQPEQWEYSSFGKFIDEQNSHIKNSEILAISPKQYKKFVMDRKDYQRELSKIKSLIIEEYSG